MDDLYPVSGRDQATWQSQAERSDHHRSRGRRPLYIGLGVVAVIVVAVCVTLYWLHARHFETTDDAFIDGYVTQMAPQVAGRVTRAEVRR